MSKLIFKIGEESIPTVTNPKDIESSPFADQLNTCLDILSDLLLKWSSTPIKGDQKEISASTESPIVNNVIAFLGERGSGKTSCLYSIKEIFATQHNQSSVYKYSSETEFLPIIDPSFFDEHHNILELFIGQLYHIYDEGLTKDWEKLSNSQRQNLRNLNGWFAKVRQSIKFLNVQKFELPEEQEGLSALSEGVNLRYYINELVKAFLKCKQKRFLVISIDDIDLNISEAYRMMEQIRKFLVIPNVVILMAAKLKQLKNNIVLNLTKYYQPIIGSVMEKQGIQQMADRYLNKFIPLERRIYMPDLADYSNVALDIIDKNEDVVSPGNNFESVEFALLFLIYKKCGYLFYNYEGTPSLIIPSNLRETRSLITNLYQMPDRQESDDAHYKNKNAFKSYFFTEWLQQLPGEQQEIANSILKEKDYTKLNKTTVSLLHEYAQTLRSRSGESLQDKTETGNLSRIRLKEIVNPANYSENISIGDVMAVLNDLKNMAGSSKINHLVFFVNTYYSMLLYESYDEMTGFVDSQYLKDEEKKEETQAGNDRCRPGFPKLKNTKEYTIPDFFKIVGKGFFTLTGDSFIIPPKNRRYSRELSPVDANLLHELINDLVSRYEEYNDIVKSPEFVLRLSMAEFFILCSSRKIETIDGSYSPFKESDWRAQSSQFYFSPFEADSKSILFEATAPFVNFVCPKYAYKRFNSKLFEIARKTPGSIAHKLFTSKRSGTLNRMHDVMSRSSIRNAEVLNDLNLWLIDNKDSYEGKKNKDHLILKDFFEIIGGSENHTGYSVKTYELNQGGEDYHTIDFSPFMILADFLKSLHPKGQKKDAGSEKDDEKSYEERYEEFKREQLALFYKIYRKQNMLSVDTAYSLGELIAILRESTESYIPLKDDIITKIVKTRKGTILSNVLVEYLAGVDVVDSKVLFSGYFDDDLFDLYKGLVSNNMHQHTENLNNKIDELQNKRTSFSSDQDEATREYRSIAPKVNSARRRLLKMNSELSEAKTKNEQISADYNALTIQLDRLHSQKALLEREMQDIKSSYDKYSESYDSIKSQLAQSGIKYDTEKQTLIIDEIYSDEINRLRLQLNEIEKNREHLLSRKDLRIKDLEDLDKRIEKLKDSISKKSDEKEGVLKNIGQLKEDIQKDELLLDSLSTEENSIIQRRNELRSILDSINKNLSMSMKEYDDFQKKRDNVISALEKIKR